MSLDNGLKARVKVLVQWQPAHENTVTSGEKK